MNTASDRGRANRRKGHNAECAVAKWLRANGWPDARTTRAELGHGGTRQPGDITGFDDRYSLEVKAVVSRSMPTWLRQAERQAAGRRPLVLVKTAPYTKVDQWTVTWLTFGAYDSEPFGSFCTQLRLLNRIHAKNAVDVVMPSNVDGPVPDRFSRHLSGTSTPKGTP